MPLFATIAEFHDVDQKKLREIIEESHQTATGSVAGVIYGGWYADKIKLEYLWSGTFLAAGQVSRHRPAVHRGQDLLF